MLEGFLSETPPNGSLLGRAMGDLQLRDHVIVPLICPTCQKDFFATSLKAHPPATAGYFAWGCFRYFGCEGV